jgi:hypothetical protein
MTALFRRPSRALPVFAALAILASGAFAAHGAAAQSSTGTVTGRVLWGACLRAIPLPMSPDAAQGEATQPATPDFAPGPASRPIPGGTTQGLPAGAVLVAVQNTSVSARTDEAGKFTLSGVPAGQYLTVAAGPVADSLSATAGRPNVLVSGGASVDIGTLALGGAGPVNIGCRFPLGAADSVPGQMAPGEAPNP